MLRASGPGAPWPPSASRSKIWTTSSTEWFLWQRRAYVGGVVPEQEAAQGREQRQRPVERRGYTLVQFSENVSPACCDAGHADFPSPASAGPNQSAVPRPSAAPAATCSRPGMRPGGRRLARGLPQPRAPGLARPHMAAGGTVRQLSHWQPDYCRTDVTARPRGHAERVQPRTVIAPLMPAGRGLAAGQPCTASSGIASEVSAGTAPGLPRAGHKLIDLLEATGAPAGACLGRRADRASGDTPSSGVAVNPADSQNARRRF